MRAYKCKIKNNQSQAKDIYLQVHVHASTVPELHCRSTRLHTAVHVTDIMNSKLFLDIGGSTGILILFWGKKVRQMKHKTLNNKSGN